MAALEDDVTVTTHYLTRGDSFDTSDLSVTFPNWKNPLDNQVVPSLNSFELSGCCRKHIGGNIFSSRVHDIGRNSGGIWGELGPRSH